MTLYRAVYIAQGEPAADTSVTGYDSGELRASATGCPVSTASDGGIGHSAADCVAVFNGVLQGGRTEIVADANTVTVAVNAADIPGGTLAFLGVYTTPATADANRVCHYAYTRQYPSHTRAAAASDTVPIIQHNSVSGLATLTNSGAL